MKPQNQLTMILAAMLLSSAAVCAAGPEVVAEAENLFARQKFKEALNLLLASHLRQTPTFPYLIAVCKCRICLAKEPADSIETIKILNQAIKLAGSGNLRDAYWLRSLAYARLNQLDNAVSDVTSCISINPRDTAAYLARAELNRLLKRYARAIDDANKVVALGELTSDGYAALARIDLALGKKINALQNWNRCLGTHSANGMFYYERGNLLAELNQREKAIADYSQALKLFGSSRWVLKARLEQYRLQRNFGAALNDVDALLKLEPQNVDWLEVRSDLHMLNGQWSLAAAGYKKLLQLSPNSKNVVGLHFMLGSVLQQSGHFEEAVAEYAAVLSAQPRNAEALVEKGACLLGLGDRRGAEEALEVADRWIEQTPVRGQFYYARGRLRAQLGKREAAIADFTKCMTLVGESPWVLRARAQQYKLLRCFGKALEDVTRGSKLQPGDLSWRQSKTELELLAADYRSTHNGHQKDRGATTAQATAVTLHFQLASALKDLGDFEKALTEYNFVLSVQPSNELAVLERGECLVGMNKLDQALEVFENAATQTFKDPVVKEMILRHVNELHKREMNFNALYHDKLNLDKLALERELVRLDQLIGSGSTEEVDRNRLYFRRAELFYDLQDYARAITDLDQILTSEPANESAVALKKKAIIHQARRRKWRQSL